MVVNETAAIVGLGAVGVVGTVAAGAAVVAATENSPAISQWRANQRGKQPPPPDDAFSRGYYPAGSIPLDVPCTDVHMTTVPECVLTNLVVPTLHDASSRIFLLAAIYASVSRPLQMGGWGRCCEEESRALLVR